MKKITYRILVAVVFLAGLSLLLYPFVANKWNTYRQERLISSYEEAVSEKTASGTINYDGEWLKARQYNAFARQQPDFADCAQLMGEYENGAGLIADVSYSAPAPSAFSLPTYWRFSFWGERGMIQFSKRWRS